MSSQSPTLRDVARVAGVSHMTVLRTLNGAKNVTPSTARKVKDVAERLGYRRDPALSALAAYRWRKTARVGGQVLAFLDCDRTGHSRMVLEGARREADYLGYRVDDFPLPSGVADQTRLSRMLYHRGVRGLLFGPAQVPCRFEGWQWHEFSPVVLDALDHSPPLNAVAMDYFHGARSAVDLLHTFGCERLGLAVQADLEARTDHRWVGGGLAADPGLCIYRSASFSARGVRQWVKKHRIDGVLTIHRGIAGVLGPQGVHTVFLNSNNAPPGVPALVLDAAEIGSEGVRMLHHALLRGEYGLPGLPKTTTLRGRWITQGGGRW